MKQFNIFGDEVEVVEELIPQPQKKNKDKVAIKFLKNCGFHYLIKDEKGISLLNAFENAPDKEITVIGDIVWVSSGINRYFPINTFDMLIDDAEPLCLDDFSDEDLKED